MLRAFKQAKKKKREKEKERQQAIIMGRDLYLDEHIIR